MGVTLYVFDSLQKVRRILTEGISRLVHREEEYMLEADVPMDVKLRPGEYLGMQCVDRTFRLFRVDEAEEDDDEGIILAKATDAAVADLSGLVVENLLQQNKTAEQAVRALVEDLGWTLGTIETGSQKETSRMYYHTVWEALQELSDLYKMRVVPSYVFANGKLWDKRIDLLTDEAAVTGLFYEAGRDAAGITVTYTGHPVTRLYGLGKSTGTEEAPANINFADEVWKESDGDPADKPRGRTWVEDALAFVACGLLHVRQRGRCLYLRHL